ncbi:MAG: phage integrase N-terminal SAM-like domain-containing protein [Deltaproteobacteria bacterium]|nr:phage integrase N-terminal SAM-like domain-containing protein [Deltaproteobacteria bacterium]
MQQASDAIRIYRYQYRGTRGRRQVAQKGVGTSGNGESLIERLREVIRLRHYAKSTEKTYLHWTRRFLAYRKHARLARSSPFRPEIIELASATERKDSKNWAAIINLRCRVMQV